MPITFGKNIGSLKLQKERARAALVTTQETFNRIQNELSNLGSGLSRLGVATSALSANRDSIVEASSRIMDLDVAQATSELVRTQILQQVQKALLAQVNQMPALALTLLKG